MTDHTRGITVRILDKEFQIACPQNQEAALLEAADFLTERMIKIRKSGRVIGIERIAIMAALNLSHELLQQRAQDTSDEGVTAEQVEQTVMGQTASSQEQVSQADLDLTDRLLSLHRKIDSALSDPHLVTSYSTQNTPETEDSCPA